MAYLVTKAIRRGNKIYVYHFWQESYRAGRKVKTRYLGAASPKESFLKRNFTGRHGLPNEQEILAQHNARVARDQAGREKALDELHNSFGLKTGRDQPTPASKCSAPASPAMPGASTGASDADAKGESGKA